MAPVSGCTRWCSSDLSHIHVDNFTLKFSDAGLELGFVASRRERLRRNVLVWHCLASVALALGLLASRHSREHFASDIAFEQALLLRSFVCIALLISGLSAVVAKCCLHNQAVAFEYMVLIFDMIAVVYHVVSDRYYLAKIFAFDPYVVWRGDTRGVVFSDAKMLLGIALVMTTSHVLFSLRWCVLWPLEIFGVLAVLFCHAYLGSPDVSDYVYHDIVLFTLVIVLIVGKRYIEIHEREDFSNVVKEKQMRCEAEFELSRTATPYGTATSTARSDVRTDTHFSIGSLPDTSVTEQLFRGITAENISQRLKNITQALQGEDCLVEVDSVVLHPDALLGCGTFGVVVAGTWQHEPVAVKMIKGGSTVPVIASMLNELRIMRYIQHPNIVRFHGACIGGEDSAAECIYVILLLEQVDGVVLDSYIANEGAQGEPSPALSARFTVLLGLCRALAYLHSRQPCVIHGDLKPANVMVESFKFGPRARLLDFGLSRRLTRHALPMGGTLLWVAPEIASNRVQKPCREADVFSCGRLIYFALTGHTPMRGLPRKDILAYFADCILPEVWRADDPPILETWKTCINHCLSMVPESRPKITEVCQSIASWLDEDSLLRKRTRSGGVESITLSEYLRLLSEDACSDGFSTILEDDLRGRSEDASGRISSNFTSLSL